jgi:hypothetical protein
MEDMLASSLRDTEPSHLSELARQFRREWSGGITRLCTSFLGLDTLKITP